MTDTVPSIWSYSLNASSSSESDQSDVFEKPIPYEAIMVYPKDYHAKKISPEQISGVRHGYAIIIALLSLVLIIIGGIFKNDCNFRKIPYLLIIGGLLGLAFSLVEIPSSIRSFKKTLLLTMSIIAVYAITHMHVLLVYEPDYYNQSSERYCNKVFYTSTLFLIVFQTAAAFMLIVYILLLNATL